MLIKNYVKRIPFFPFWYRIYINVFVYLKWYHDISMIRNSGLFDKEYYYRNNRSVKKMRINPFVHYLLYGAKAGKNPGSSFDNDYYLEKYPEVRKRKLNPLLHFITTGRGEGRIPFAFKDYPSLAELEEAMQRTHEGKKFSVIMPTWNRKMVVANAIDSVLCQSYKNFELIICDDGSTDKTGKFIRKRYSKEIKDGKIRFYTTEHKGVSAARNLGLQKAEGEWITYLDSDNAWRKDYLLLVSKAYMDDEGIQSIYASILKHDLDRNIEFTLKQIFDLRLLRKSNFIDLNIYSHKKELYHLFGGFNEDLTRFVDYDMILRQAEHYPPFQINYTLCDYYLSSSLKNITLTINADQNFDLLRKKWIDENENLGRQDVSLRVPQGQDIEKGWKAYPAFQGRTSNLEMFSCHSSVLSPGKRPHDPHEHREEEILIMLHGEVDIILPGLEIEQKRKLRQGQFVYYPAYFKHTLENTGENPSNYLMFKWFVTTQQEGPHLPFTFIEDLDPLKNDRFKSSFKPALNFEGPSLYCRKLQCHTSYLQPGGGYDKHLDGHDVAIIVLEGEVITNDRVAVPYDIIFYPAGLLHDMHNKGDEAARYLVFEFHN